MMNTFSSRATFYDVVGYLVPGLVFIGGVWFWMLAFVDCDLAIRILRAILKHGVFASFAMVIVGYIAGHLANSASSWLLEKHLCADLFKNNKSWVARLENGSPERLARIQEVVRKEYGVKIASLATFDVRIRMEEKMPHAAITGFSFLAFYGMSRTLSLLFVFVSLPISVVAGGLFEGVNALAASAMTFGGMMFAAALFLHQYLRFVSYYYDFLGSTLTYSDVYDEAKGKDGHDG